jgi:hypothetical protein
MHENGVLYPVGYPLILPRTEQPGLRLPVRYPAVAAEVCLRSLAEVRRK